MRGHPRPRASSSCRTYSGKSAKTLLDLALQRNQQGELTDEDLEGNHAANHRELECQRSAQSASTYHVLGKNLEHLQKRPQAGVRTICSAEYDEPCPKRKPCVNPTAPPRRGTGMSTVCFKKKIEDRAHSSNVPPSAARGEPLGKDRMREIFGALR